MTIPAKYENGVFRPLEDVAIREGTVVQVHVPADSEIGTQRRSMKNSPFTACGLIVRISLTA